MKFLEFSRASWATDFVAVAMVIVVPVMLYSVYSARGRKNVERHRRLQIALACVLASAVLVFEIDMRIHGWRHLAEPSPFYETLVYPALLTHLFFSIPTFFMWAFLVVSSLKNFTKKQQTLKDPRRHKKIGMLAVIGMTMTSVTGWLFYWLAFVA